jgi:sortase A
MGYVYVKKVPSPSHQSSKVKPPKKIFAAVLFSFGIFLFFSALFPIIQFQLEYALKFNQVISPLSTRFADNGSVLGELDTDFTQLSNWFVTGSGITNAPGIMVGDNGAGTYQISIPKLKVDNAIVTVGSLDLKKSLIQYPQTALPGQLGSPVIFGHSVLPQFFNPKSYLTIFSTLYKLKTGDEIFIDYDNIRYRYLVEEMYEVSPNDLSVLEQRFDGRYLTLITCSPPGTYLRRLIIKARIVET